MFLLDKMIHFINSFNIFIYVNKVCNQITEAHTHTECVMCSDKEVACVVSDVTESHMRRDEPVFLPCS